MLKSQDSNFKSDIIRRKFDEGYEIRPFPRAVNQLITALKDPNADSRTLANIIQLDAGLSTRLLRMSNSVIFGVTQELTSISHAITLLGRRPLRNLAYFHACSTLFSGSTKTARQREEIWNHSLGCAIAARLLASSTPSLSKDDAFLGGLFHDIGKLFLLSTFPNEYGKLSTSKWGNDLLRIEKDLFGCTHDELGLRLIVAWPLRDNLKVAIRYHHNPEEVDTDPALTRVLRVADVLARSAGIGSSAASEESAAEFAHEFLGLDEQQLFAIQDEAFNVFIETKQIWAG